MCVLMFMCDCAHVTLLWRRFPFSPNKTTFLPGLDATAAHGLSNTSFFRMTAVFVAPSTGLYSFMVSCDGRCRLLMSSEALLASTASAVAFTSVATGHHVWNASSSQESTRLSLLGGHSYYLELQGQGSYAAVAGTLHRALFNHKDTSAAQDEVQVSGQHANASTCLTLFTSCPAFASRRSSWWATAR